MMLEDEEDTEMDEETCAAHYGSQLKESNAKGDVVKLNSNILDCPICLDLLQPPILQCSNGHFACSSCISKILDKKCPSCSLPAGDIRNRGLEAVVQGARISCSFQVFGCLAFVSISQKVKHEVACRYAPCFCPIKGCDFQCKYLNLADHIKNKHSCAAIHKLNYTQETNLHLCPDDSFAILLDSNSPVFLVAISSDHMPSVSSIMLVCLRPRLPHRRCKYTYELEVSGSNGCKLQLKDTPVFTRRWSGDFAGNNFLYVPHRMASTDRSFQLMLRIRRSFL